MDEVVEHRLRRAGLRVTRPRLAVLGAVHDHPHADTATIIAAVRARVSAVSHQAVYDCLHALTDAGLLRRIQPAGSAARYELRVGDNHHHLVCRACGRVVDVECRVGPAPCLVAPDDHGFAIDEAEVIYWGWCPSCAGLAHEAPSTPSGASASPPSAPAPPDRPSALPESQHAEKGRP